MAPELAIRILSSELPLDGLLGSVASELPLLDFAPQSVAVGPATIQALAAEDADFDLRHVQPARVLGCVVKLHAPQQLGGRAAPQNIVEAFPEVDVQVIQHEVDPARPGVGATEQRGDEFDEVDLATLRGDRDHTLSCLGLDGDEQVAGAAPDVLVVVLGEDAGRHRQWRTTVTDQLQTLLVDAHHGFAWIERLGVQRQQRVRAVTVLLGQLADAPHQPPPGLEVVFLGA